MAVAFKCFYHKKYVCGATLISKQYLLTAANCVLAPNNLRRVPKKFHALLGHYDLNDKDDPNSVKSEISEFFVHNDWKSWKSNAYRSNDADIALFQMKSEIEFTTLIQPICLPDAGAKIFDVDGIVAGYGFSENSRTHGNRPKHVKIKSVANEVCFFSVPMFAQISSQRMFCAGERGKNPCRGDHGGPFMVNERGQWSIIGIVSASIGECHENDFVLFTQVPKFIDWIRKVVDNDQPLICDFELKLYIKHFTSCQTSTLKVLQPNVRIKSVSFDNEASNSSIFKRIETIWIDHAQVHYLPDFTKANEILRNFKKLYITDSELKELSKSKLAIIPHLTELIVNGNEIKELADNVFDDLINLEILDFANNKVKLLPQKLLSKLPKLKQFWAGSNLIENVPAGFFGSNRNIEKVDFYNNKIMQMEITLNSMPKLVLFDLKKNRCIDAGFETSSNFDEYLTKIEKLQEEIDRKCAKNPNEEL